MASSRPLANLNPKQQKAKQVARDDAARQQLSSALPSQYLGTVKHPARFLKNLQAGKGPALGRMGMLQAGARMLGYYGTQDPYAKHEQDQLAAGAPVDLRQGETPTQTQYGAYVRAHLGQSLSPEEEAAIRTPEREAVESGAQQASRDESQRMAAAGIDPRSGIGADRAAMVQRARESGLAGVERDVVGARLQRQQSFENQAAGQGAQEQGARQYDVSAGLRRLGDVEQGNANLAGLNERQREFDTTYTEGQRQAQLGLDLSRQAAKALKPTGVQQAGSVIGAIL